MIDNEDELRDQQLYKHLDKHIDDDIEESVCLTNVYSEGYTRIDTSSFTCDIVCNGFSMIDVIMEVFSNHPEFDFFGCERVLADEIKDAFAIKLHLKEFKWQ